MITIIVLLGLISCSKPKASLLIYGAKVYTVNGRFDTASAIAICGDSIVAVGSREQLEAANFSSVTRERSTAILYRSPATRG